MGGGRSAIVVAVAAVAAAVAAVVTSAVVVVAPRGVTVNNPLQTGSTVAAAVATNDTLTVVGYGSGTAAPDQARVTLGVAPERGSANDAVNTAAGEMGKLVSTLHDQGVVDADIQTTTVNVSQDFSCCPRNVSGYIAETDVTVLIHHLANVGSVIAAATQAIGNDIRINGVSLSISDPGAAAQAARKAAMADAAARAKEWAGLSGRQLGRLVGISESVSSQPFPTCPPGGGCGGGGIPIQAGQAAVTVSVTVAYQLNG